MRVKSKIKCLTHNDIDIIQILLCNGEDFRDDNTVHTAFDAGIIKRDSIDQVVSVLEMAFNACLDKLYSKEKGR